MFGAHLPELLIVLVLALVVFGPKRLPEIGGALGKSIKEFKDGTSELRDHASITDSQSQPTASPPPVDAARREEATPVASGSHEADSR